MGWHNKIMGDDVFWCDLFMTVKNLSCIMVTCSVLMLLLFGAGGIGWQKCSCTGHVSLVSPSGDSCCKGSSCMTVKVLHVSAAELQQNVQLVDCVVVPCAVAWSMVDSVCCSDVRKTLETAIVDTGPPLDWRHHIVMRV